MTDPYPAAEQPETFDPDQMIGPDDVIELEPFMRGGLIGVDDRPASAARTAVMVPKDNAPGDTSDGYHTFDELYEHRKALTMVLATIAAIDGDSWRSKQHHPDDGPMFDDHFIVGINLATGPISYHYALSAWDDFAGVPVLEHAPKWDGADPDDTVLRLRGFAGHLRIAIEEGREVQQAAREAADAVVERSGQPDLARPCTVAFADEKPAQRPDGVILCQVDETVDPYSDEEGN